MEDRHAPLTKTATPPMEASALQSQSLPTQLHTQPRLPPPSKQPPSSLPKSDSQVKLLMEITAISGEYPANNIHRIIPSASYAKKVLAALIADRLLKPVNKSNVRGYRLDTKAKRQLLAENHARYKDYMEGATDTNKQRSDHPRRLRLHSTAEVYTLMQNAGVRIFKDTKPKVYLLDDSTNPSQAGSSQSALSQPSVRNTEGKTAITVACFYSSREQKGADDKAIRGSRAVGTLLTPTHAYAVYNTGNAESQWLEGVEARYSAEVRDYICRRVLLSQYRGEPVGGLMIGGDLEILYKYLTAQTKTTAVHIFFEKTYRPFYFITNDDNGESQLNLLCNSKMNSLKHSMLNGLCPVDEKHPVEHDAMTEDGNPVLFCCLPDIPRLIKFRIGIHVHGKFGTVIAFDFQKEMLGKYLGNRVEFITLNLEKTMEML